MIAQSPSITARSGTLRFLGGVLIGIAAIYVLYVVAIALILNTALFAKLTEMTDREETNLRFSRAWSIIPGKIHAGKIYFDLREDTLDLDIELSGATIDLDLTQLRNKRAHMRRLHVNETTVTFRTKEDAERAEKVELKGTVAELQKKAADEEQKRLKNRWKIEIDRVELPKITRISFDKSILTGEMGIIGAFMIQPGTQAEIKPSTLTIRDGKWNDDLTEIQLQATVGFEHFMKSKARGSDVYQYLNANVKGTAKAESLNIVNVTLRSMGDYEFGKGAADLATELEVKAGKIIAGSFFRTKESAIRFASSRFEVAGKGDLHWQALPGDRSRLHVEIRDAESSLRMGENKMRGSVKKIDAQANLLGLDLRNAFSGLVGRLKIIGGKIASTPDRDAKADDLQLTVRARLNGELSVIAGEYKDKKGLPAPSSFTVELDQTHVKIPDLATLHGTGQLRLAVRPIDLRYGRAELPELFLTYTGEIDGKFPFQLNLNSKEAVRVFGSSKPENDHWHGRGDLQINKFDGILSYLRETDRISAIVRAGLYATEFQTKAEWEIADRATWVRIRELETNGIWSGFGTLIAEKLPHGKSRTRGAFEGKILGIPIGIGLTGKDTEVKVLPGEDWFDQLRKQSSPRSTATVAPGAAKENPTARP